MKGSDFKLSSIKAPLGLSDSVMLKIEHQSYLRARRRFVFSFITNIFSFICAIPASIWLYRDIFQSGFAQSVSLVFSDGSLFLTYWRDFVSFMIETLPFVSLSISLTAIFVFLLSLGMVFNSRHKLSRVKLT